MFHFDDVQYSELVHEKLSDVRFEGLKQVRRAPADSKHEIVFAIQQNEKGLKKLEKILDDISSPDSLQYRQWLTFDKITELVGNNDATAAVLLWLKNSYSVGPSGEKVFANVTWQSIRGEYIKATATIDHWEKVLKTKFYDFSVEHILGFEKTSFDKVCRSYDYKLPVHLEKHVFSLFNTVQVPPPLRQRYHLRTEEEVEPAAAAQPEAGRLRRADSDSDSNRSSSAPRPHANGLTPVTVSFLNSLYRVPSNQGSGAQSQSVFETDAGPVSEYFSPDDLKSFQQNYKLPVQAASVANGNSLSPASQCLSSPSTISCMEGNLDIQYISGMAQYTESVYWYMPSKAGNPDPFVAWITAVSGTSKPPLSNSISWSSSEYYMTAKVMTAFNTEAMKLAALGVTVVASTGDDGAPNQIQVSSSAASVCACSIDSSSSNRRNYWTQSGGGGAGTSNRWTGQGYFPNYPASCPYVTAVGATMGPESGGREVACQSDGGGVITSGGGFSTYFATPSWQRKAVSEYLAQVNLTAGFNPYGRAYPDISLLGTNYQTFVSGKIYSLYGTSASAPVFAAFISLMNARLRSQGRSPLGFVNPTLYYAGYNQSRGGSRPQFNDITSGNNLCCAAAAAAAVCCKAGFLATPGWDPVTGWGSVNFPSFAAMYNVSSSATSAAPAGPLRLTSPLLPLLLMLILLMLLTSKLL